jgi:lambda repressor-like predicted transcriptional regulator
MDIDGQIGHAVHDVMWRLGTACQQINVAPQAGLTQSALSKKILGKRSWYVDEVILVAGALGVDPLEIFASVTETESTSPSRIRVKDVFALAAAMGIDPKAIFEAALSGSGGGSGSGGFRRTLTRRGISRSDDADPGDSVDCRELHRVS